FDLLHCGFDVGHLASVRLNGQGSIADFFGSGLQSLLVPSGDRHLRALACVGFGNPQTNSTVAARDNGNFALKSLCAHKAPLPLNWICTSILAKARAKESTNACSRTGEASEAWRYG